LTLSSGAKLELLSEELLVLLEEKLVELELRELELDELELDEDVELELDELRYFPKANAKLSPR